MDPPEEAPGWGIHKTMSCHDPENCRNPTCFHIPRVMPEVTPHLRAGMQVKLKSGSPQLTVVGIDGKGQLTVAWFGESGELSVAVLPVNCFEVPSAD